MRDGFHQFAYLHFDAQFLHQFPAKTLFERLACFALAARELPKATQMTVGRSLSNKKPAVAEDKAGGDVNGVHGSGSMREMETGAS